MCVLIATFVLTNVLTPWIPIGLILGLAWARMAKNIIRSCRKCGMAALLDRSAARCACPHLVVGGEGLCALLRAGRRQLAAEAHAAPAAAPCGAVKCRSGILRPALAER